eukprot:TRINITY_DN27391_c0_g1_i2.p2 TRINITY_DN27391_c0_g1~~TRINITY_DN27391_c0_g1_i2.p2  ORF type:complete len:270 (-),score=44.01 TRINITY_DN27391_c0_g1_i2:59-868(-)
MFASFGPNDDSYHRQTSNQLIFTARKRPSITLSILVLFAWFPFLIRSQAVCIGNQTITTCPACGLEYYPNVLSTNLYFDIPAVNCLPKLTVSTYNSTFYVFGQDVNPSQYPTLIPSYTSLGSALLAAFKAATPYRYSELRFYLLGTTHFINFDDFPTSETIKPLLLFRRLNTSITIEPLPCSVSNITSLCFNPGYSERPTIYLKTEQFHIFVANSLIFRNLIVDGTDLHLEFFNAPQKSLKSLYCANASMELNYSSQTAPHVLLSLIHI